MGDSLIKELDFKDFDIINKINAFLIEHNESDYMQSIEWNIIRNENNKYYVYYLDFNGNIVFTCNLLEKEKNNEKYLYAPRGPVLDFNNKETTKLFLYEIKKWMNNKGYKKLVINPYISFDVVEKIKEFYNVEITRKNDYDSLHDSCTLAIMDIIFDEEKLIEKLPSKFRQNTRRSYRKGLRSKISNVVDFENFYKLYIETSIRHDFRAHDLKYFKKLYSTFKDKLIFLEVWYNDIPLAMSIDIIYNNKLIYLYGVSSTENRNLLGMYNLQWEAIKYCINNKIEKYDFGGVFCDESDLDNKDIGLYNFKKGYCYNGFIDNVPDLLFDFREV